MSKFWVYVHTCPNGKKYVGTTTADSPEYRWGKGGGRYRGNEYFFRAIQKYGWENITHEILEVDSAEEMYRKEVELISFYHSNDSKHGYNHSEGGERSAKGVKRSEEFKQKMSLRLKGRSRPELKGKPLSEQHKLNISKTLKGRPVSGACKKAWEKAVKGNSRSQEFKEKVQKGIKEKWKDPEYRNKQLTSFKGIYLFPDGTTRCMSIQNVTRHYLNKGIEVTRIA